MDINKRTYPCLGSSSCGFSTRHRPPATCQEPHCSNPWPRSLRWWAMHSAADTPMQQQCSCSTCNTPETYTILHAANYFTICCLIIAQYAIVLKPPRWMSTRWAMSSAVWLTKAYHIWYPWSNRHGDQRLNNYGEKHLRGFHRLLLNT